MRQLEALVRLSESFARMALQTEVTLAHVAMALDLFKSSTMEAVKAGLTHAAPEGETLKQIQRLEERIRGRVHINGHLSVRRLVDDMVRCASNCIRCTLYGFGSDCCHAAWRLGAREACLSVLWPTDNTQRRCVALQPCPPINLLNFCLIAVLFPPPPCRLAWERARPTSDVVLASFKPPDIRVL